MKLVIFFLMLFSIHSVEIVLKSGEVFIGDLVSENTYQVKLNWKGKEYTIPRQDIESIDLKKKGKHISYKVLNFKLKDGSQIKGAVAEDNKDFFILKTDVGFLTIDKSKIKSHDSIEEAVFPDNYLNQWNPEKLRIGIYGVGFENSSPIQKQHPNTYGGGIFIEPVSLLFFSYFQLGYKSEYLTSDGSGQGSNPCILCTKYGRFDFFNNFLYLKYNLKKTELLDFYFSIGLGASAIRYKLQETTLASIYPISTYEIGWQGIKFGKFFIRISIRANIVHEKNINLGQTGMELSLGRSF